ncbi:hypothetical protein PHJA_001033300 [Phtheirospermum japonicum]|uniref:Uncharacterized protein n=1 Tax=Phtheirospermum japonicum TaxID=374723 RepID=A0A830BPY9_9LAMI|nr:hypothetical protein PHJA_001033300 [Phtheirospermum japonicum]
MDNSNQAMIIDIENEDVLDQEDEDEEEKNDPKLPYKMMLIEFVSPVLYEDGSDRSIKLVKKELYDLYETYVTARTSLNLTKDEAQLRSPQLALLEVEIDSRHSSMLVETAKMLLCASDWDHDGEFPFEEIDLQ